MRNRAVLVWLTLSAYSLALLAAYALHPPHIGDCTSGHCCFPPPGVEHHGCGHPEHASQTAGHDRGADEHSPTSPIHEGDDCVWCQFLALAAWQGPDVAELPLAVPVGTLAVLAPRQLFPQSLTLHPARGPPIILLALAA